MNFLMDIGGHEVQVRYDETTGKKYYYCMGSIYKTLVQVQCAIEKKNTKDYAERALRKYGGCNSKYTPNLPSNKDVKR